MAAIVNIEKDKIVLRAKIYFYGTLSTAVLVNKILSEINRFWNVEGATFEHLGIAKKIYFDISGNHVTTARAGKIMRNNRSKAINFVRIEQKNISERSMMGYGLGDNSGHWIITDQLGESTTAAHEFGHALGLPHPAELDYRNTGLPPIMAPRGTLVDKPYQWNPLADAGMPGGTMRPIFRRVRLEEIQAVLEPIPQSDIAQFGIGFLSNTFYDEVGNKIVR